MQEIEYISVKKAASLLGVSVSSVKRWVDAGALPAVKTCGGHRRLRMDDVMAMQSAAAVTEPEVSGQEAGLSCVQCHSIPDPAQAHHHLLGCVERGDYEGLAHGRQSLLVSGMGIAMLGDAVIFPLMADIGHSRAFGGAHYPACACRLEDERRISLFRPRSCRRGLLSSGRSLLLG